MHAQSALVLGVLTLAGCRHLAALAPDGVLIDAGDCLPARVLPLTIRNAGPRAVAFAVNGPDGPPCRLQPDQVALLHADTGAVWSRLLEHSRPASFEAVIEPGDGAAFIIEPAAMPAADDSGGFVLELRDIAWRPHRSAALPPCTTADADAARARE